MLVTTKQAAYDWLFDNIPSNCKLGIKVHFGRTKKPNSYIPPEFFKPIQKHVKRAVFFDTNTLYGGERGSTLPHLKVAKSHGFSPAIILSEDTPVKYQYAEVPNGLLMFDLVLNASHFTGHKIAGFGGCIKNIGMGMVTSKTKLWVHAAGELVHDTTKCKECGWCKEECGHLSPEGRKPTCTTCAKCVGYCKAVRFSFGKQTEVSQRLALAARDVIQHIPMLHLAYIHNPTKLCDCMGDHTDTVLKECFGISISTDLVEADNDAVNFVLGTKTKARQLADLQLSTVKGTPTYGGLLF